MPNTLKIKRSTSLSAPTSLQFGEMAWSNGGEVLYIGDSDGSVISVGGEGAFQRISTNLTEISTISSLPIDEGTVPIVDNTGTFIGAKGFELLTMIGVVGNYLPLTGGTLTGRLDIHNEQGPSLSTWRDVSVGISNPNLGMDFHPNDRLITLSGIQDRPGIFNLNNPKLDITLGDIAGRVNFTLSSTNGLKVLGMIEAAADGNSDSAIGGSIRFKVKRPGANQLLEPLTIYGDGNVLVGLGNTTPSLPGSLQHSDNDRILSVLGTQSGRGYLVLGQGTSKGALRFHNGRIQSYENNTWVTLSDTPQITPSSVQPTPNTLVLRDNNGGARVGYMESTWVQAGVVNATTTQTSTLSAVESQFIGGATFRNNVLFEQSVEFDNPNLSENAVLLSVRRGAWINRLTVNTSLYNAGNTQMMGSLLVGGLTSLQGALQVQGNAEFNNIRGTFRAKDPMDMSGYVINNVADPIESDHAATKNYVDNLVSSRSYTVDVGDGVANIYLVTHNLGSLDVIVQVYDKVSRENVDFLFRRVDLNTLEVNFSQVVPTNRYRVIIIRA